MTPNQMLRELVTLGDRLGIQPYTDDENKPSLVPEPASFPLHINTGSELADSLRRHLRITTEYHAYAVQKLQCVEMEKIPANPKYTRIAIKTETPTPEEFAVNDYVCNGPALIHPSVFDRFVGTYQQNGAACFLNCATLVKIPFNRVTIFPWLVDGHARERYYITLRNFFGDATADIVKEYCTSVADDIARMCHLKSIREQAKDAREDHGTYYGRKAWGSATWFMKQIGIESFKHCCRPQNAKQLLLTHGQKGVSPYAMATYNEDSPLSRYLIMNTYTHIGGMPPTPGKAVWWWENLEIRKRINLRYVPKQVSPEKWGWLLRAGVPPVVLCEHKLTKAEAAQYCDEHVGSWRPDLRKHLSEGYRRVPDWGLYFQDDKMEAISGDDIFNFRFKEKIAKIKEVARGLGYTESHAIDTALNRGHPLVREWALNKIDWLLKKHEVHGPAGRVYEFMPISRIDEVRVEDLGGSADAKPERVFERMGERIKLEIEAENAKGFGFPEWKHPLHPEMIYLGNSVALQQEGKIMHHCCGSYSRKCEQGETFIFHIGPPAPMGSTVEAKMLDNKLKIFQHYGPRNSTPDETDKKVVLEWVKMCRPKRVKKQTNPPLRWRDVVLCQPMRG
jgi:hypothetical protein